MKPQRPAFNCYGGKWLLAKWILTLFPPHICYVEPYCGAASLLFQKTRSRSEVINDLDSDVVNFFQILRDRKTEFIEHIRFTPYARAEHNWAKTYTGSDSLERARAFYILSRQGFGGGGRGGWTHGKTGRQKLSWSKSLWASLEQCAARLYGVQIECNPAEAIIEIYDGPGTLYYLDPPYLPAVRGSHKDYKEYEMSLEQHEALLTQLLEIRGMALLSSYPSTLYDNTLTDWKRFDYHTTSSQSLTRGPRKGHERIECVWMNPWAYKVWTAHRIKTGEIK